MRACEGCRRRKIKCDAATTNTWPCSACIRLKLHCVPPTVNYDRDAASGNPGFDGEKGIEFDASDGSGEEDYSQHLSMQHHLVDDRQPAQTNAAQMPYSESMGVYQPSSYIMPSHHHHRSLSMPYNGFHEQTITIPEPSYQTHETIFATPPNQTVHPAQDNSKTPESWHSGQYSPDIIETLGELKIQENGIGMCAPICCLGIDTDLNQRRISRSKSGTWLAHRPKKNLTTTFATYRCLLQAPT